MFELAPWRKGRSLGRWEDADWPLSLRREMDRLFDDFFTASPKPLKALEGAFDPSIDVSETDKELEVTAEVPGVDEKDIEVTVAEGVLTIRGEKKTEKEEKDKAKNFYRLERSYGAFQRSFQLPADYDDSKVEATFNKGVLKVVVPKKPQAKAATKKIEVKKAS